MVARSLTSQLDYDSYITSRTRDFTGREWVFDKIEEWLAAPGGTPIFLLSGGPGTGKSAVASRFAQMSRGEVDATRYPALGRDSLAYFHFCQAGLENTLSPLTFVQALSEALAKRYPAFRVALEGGGSRQIIVNSAVTVEGDVQAGAQVVGTQIPEIHIEIKGSDARPMFDEAVRLPIQALCEQLPAERIVIMVDSLDEALSFNADNNIAQLLGLVNVFPPQVRFFLTCRSNSNRVFDLVGPPSLDLIADAPRGLDEVKHYALSRLRDVSEPLKTEASGRIAEKSQGNFLYAFHVLNDLVKPGVKIESADTIDLPDELEGVYRKFLERELATSQTRWSDVYRPLLGSIAVARGEGLTKSQLIGITGLAEGTTNDVLQVCAQYLVGGEVEERPFRIYHQSFRDFLLRDKKRTVYPADRHAAVARYLQKQHGSNWGVSKDGYALRYTPVHWAEAAALSEEERADRTQQLVGLTSLKRYQRRFEERIGDLPLLQQHLHRAVQVAAMNDRGDMLVWLLKAARAYTAFRRDFLEAESLLASAEEGELEQAEARLAMFGDVGEDWQTAARLILAWLGAAKAPAAATLLRDRLIKNLPALEPLPLLRDRVTAALSNQPEFAFEARQALSLEIGRELVNRIGGQAFDRELLISVNPSLITELGFQSEMISKFGYAAAFDAPILVHIAREQGSEGTELIDEYIGAHAGYNYVEYRNQSLWLLLHAVLRHHPDQEWVKQRLRRILAVALSGGGVDFGEMLPLTAAVLADQADPAAAKLTLDEWRIRALDMADQLQNRRGANDSWGSHKRRLTALTELYKLIVPDKGVADQLLARINSLPGGFAGFEAPAMLRLADALRACSMDAPELIRDTIDGALQSAHHIQDYHFCARVTARCNALKRWHESPLSGSNLADAIRRLAAGPNDAEFAADHVIHEPYAYRLDNDPDTLPVHRARDAETLEQLAEVFQRPALEFLRLNPTYTLSEAIASKMVVRVPDPGLPPLLALHFSARALGDKSLKEERTALVRSLVPVTVNNATALDTVLSYLLICAQIEDSDLMSEIVDLAGPVSFASQAAPTAQIGPDGVIPT